MKVFNVNIEIDGSWILENNVALLTQTAPNPILSGITKSYPAPVPPLHHGDDLETESEALAYHEKSVHEVWQSAASSNLTLSVSSKLAGVYCPT